MPLLLFAAAAGARAASPPAYKYYRFVPVKTRGGGRAVAAAEVLLRRRGVSPEAGGVSASSPAAAAGAAGAAAVDGDTDTHWRDDSLGSLTIHIAAGQEADQYSFITSVELGAEFDPLMWILEASHDGSAWDTLDQRTAADWPTPKGRGASAGWIDISGRAWCGHGAAVSPGDGAATTPRELDAATPFVLTLRGCGPFSPGADRVIVAREHESWRSPLRHLSTAGATVLRDADGLEEGLVLAQQKPLPGGALSVWVRAHNSADKLVALPGRARGSTDASAGWIRAGGLTVRCATKCRVVVAADGSESQRCGDVC